MKKQILSEEFKRMQKLAGIINEALLDTVDDFAIHYGDDDFFDSFWLAIHKEPKTLDPDKKEDWNTITNMSAEELKDNYGKYGLTPEFADKVKNVFDNELSK